MSPDPPGIPPDLPPDVLGRIPLFAELQKVLAWSGGPVNWDLARQIAVAQAAAAEPAHGVDDADAAEFAEDARVAELWIGEATGIIASSPLGPVRTMTPAQWAEHACGAYRELVDPLAAKVAAAITQQAPDAMGTDAPPGFDAGAMAQALERMAPLFLGVQTGGVIGAVAKDVLGGYDVPLPSDDSATIAIVKSNVDRVAADYALDPKQVRMWVTMHEASHRLVFEALPAARTAFFARFLDSVASLRVDFSGAIERLQRLDLSDPTGMDAELGVEGLFDLAGDQTSSEATTRLEQLIALVEAFCDRMIETAADGRLPAAGRIAEAVTRHRSGTDGARALRQFIGLGTSEEPGRDADAFTRAVLNAGGWPALGRMWNDTETLPTPGELSDADAWLRRMD
ncbi:MAG: zinc-dependent metalloprotease [Actinomycetota bacterium]